jgi:hypothetical protein
LIDGLSHLVQRFIQRACHLIAIAHLQAPLYVVRVNLDGQADPFIHGDREWLRYPHQMLLNEAGRYPA